VLKLAPVTLEGRAVTLRSLDPTWADRFVNAALGAPEIFRFMPHAMQTEADLRRWIEHALAKLVAGTGLPFVTLDRESGAIAGSTSVTVTDAASRRVEIGGTWVLPAFQRTHVNTEAKYLQLRHAFETLGVLRVEFKTDARNLRSQQAMERLGAVREGTLRAHMICHDGYVRDSVYFSVIAPEWPRLRSALEARMAAGRPLREA
jgi:RimJ/RimL family protein N-acetyltransferase